MKIVTKQYDSKGKLHVLRRGEKPKGPIIRFTQLRNKTWHPCCDFHGTCINKAYAEVFPMMKKNNAKKGWSYLCRRHYYEEEKRLKWKLPACLHVEW